MEGVALASACEYIRLENDSNIDDKLRRALEVAGKDVPVKLDVLVDYSQATRFIKGISKPTWRALSSRKSPFPVPAIKRQVTG